jgi:hypothetical protein
MSSPSRVNNGPSAPDVRARTPGTKSGQRLAWAPSHRAGAARALGDPLGPVLSGTQLPRREKRSRVHAKRHPGCSTCIHLRSVLCRSCSAGGRGSRLRRGGCRWRRSGRRWRRSGRRDDDGRSGNGPQWWRGAVRACHDGQLLGGDRAVPGERGGPWRPDGRHGGYGLGGGRGRYGADGWRRDRNGPELHGHGGSGQRGRDGPGHDPVRHR